MPVDPRELVLLDGWAVTGVTSPNEQQPLLGGLSPRRLLHALMQFAAATRRFFFDRAKR